MNDICQLLTEEIMWAFFSGLEIEYLMSLIRRRYILVNSSWTVQEI